MIVTYHTEFYHFKLKLNHTNFSLKFTLADTVEIKRNGIYLISLLIFGLTHRLLWENTIFRQYLSVNHTNSLTFIVKDVCK